MKTLKLLLLSIMALVFNVAVSAGIAPAIGLPFGAIFGGLTITSITAASFVPSGVLSMAITKEIWINDIVENLFKSNPHLNYAMNADQFVLAGKVVHIPNAGSKPAVKRNRTNFPASVTIREDVDITFSLDEYTSDPMKITNAEKYELSYDKRASVTGEQSNAIAELVGDWFFYYWAPTSATCFVRTTGDNTTAHIGTGNRKAVVAKDVKNCQKAMNKQGVSKLERYAILDADMYDQFTDSLSITQYRDFSASYNQAEGIVGKLFGFTFLDSRATVLRYSNDSTPEVRDPDAAGASTDNAAGLFWQKDCVIRALGDKEMFENVGDPTHYGDIYSALLRAGGRKKRNDGKGVIALIQAAGA